MAGTFALADIRRISSRFHRCPWALSFSRCTALDFRMYSSSMGSVIMFMRMTPSYTLISLAMMLRSLSRTMPRSRSQVLRSPARARAFCIGRDDLIRTILRNRPYAVRHIRVTCMVIDNVESRYTPRSRMLADVLTSLPHMSI